MSAPHVACLQAQLLLDRIYAQPLGGCGCCWHVVFDEGNYDADSVRYCVEHVNPIHADCTALGALVSEAGFSRTQMRKLSRGGYGKPQALDFDKSAGRVR